MADSGGLGNRGDRGSSGLGRSASGLALAYFGLGSNLGDRLGFLAQAARRLAEADGIVGLRLSPVYETTPVGVIDQPLFLNAVAEAGTTLSPLALLTIAQEIELSLGRERENEVRWGPRKIDIDLLLVGDTLIETEELTLPHPRMFERAFVLRPLADLAHDLVPPGTHRPVREVLATFGQSGVRLFEASTDWWLTA